MVNWLQPSPWATVTGDKPPERPDDAALLKPLPGTLEQNGAYSIAPRAPRMTPGQAALMNFRDGARVTFTDENGNDLIAVKIDGEFRVEADERLIPLPPNEERQPVSVASKVAPKTSLVPGGVQAVEPSVAPGGSVFEDPSLGEPAVSPSDEGPVIVSDDGSDASVVDSGSYGLLW